MKLETDNILAARKALKSSLAIEARSSSIGVFGIAGRKTGIVLDKPIFQDEDELDNIDSYWNAAVASPEIKATVAPLDKKATLKGIAHAPSSDSRKSMAATTPKQDSRRRSSIKSILKSKKSIGNLEQGQDTLIDNNSHGNASFDGDHHDNDDDKENQAAQEDSFAFTRKPVGSRSSLSVPLQEPTAMVSEDDEISFKDNSNVEPLAEMDGYMHEEEFGTQEPDHAAADSHDDRLEDEAESEHTDLHEQEAVAIESLDAPVSASAPKRAPSKRKGKSFDRQLTELVVESESEAGVRDKRRRRFRPLEFWKNERVVYGRRESAARLHMPAVLDVITMPSDEPSVDSTRRRRETLAGSSLKKRGYKEKELVMGSVYDVDQDQEVSKMIMISPDQFKPKAVPNHDFKLHTTFSEGGYVTAGVLSFPKEAIKPNKNSGKHTLFFTVLSGVFKVTVHQLTFIATTGCQFIVPRGNQYEIRNMTNKESRLSYCHCKDLQAEQEQMTRSQLDSETQANISATTSSSSSSFSSSSKSSDESSSNVQKRTLPNRSSRRK